jgi:hypothetical protein
MSEKSKIQDFINNPKVIEVTKYIEWNDKWRYFINLDEKIYLKRIQQYGNRRDLIITDVCPLDKKLLNKVLEDLSNYK